MDSILPHASSAAERRLDAMAAERIARLDPRMITALWDSQRVPEELLPALAWSLSIDEWRPEWPAALKRAAIAAAAEVHRIKGTDGAVLAALRTIGIDARLEDWHDHLDDPTWHSRDGNGKARPFTFRIIIESFEDDARLDQLKRVVNCTKRAAAHYEVLTLNDPALGAAYTLAAGLGETLVFVGQDIDISAVPTTASPRISATAASVATLAGERLTTLAGDPLKLLN